MMYKGSCHCKAVIFEIEAPQVIEADRCNCSICAKSGYLHLILPASKFRLISGASHLHIVLGLVLPGIRFVLTAGSNRFIHLGQTRTVLM